MPRRASFRYLGDQDALVVHDLDHEDEEACQVRSLLRSGRGVTFRPDRLSEALRRAFGRCPHCLGGDGAELADEEALVATNRADTFRDRGHQLRL